MAKVFGIKDSVSGLTVVEPDGQPRRMTYDDAKIMLDNIRRYHNTDYFIIELEF